MGAPKAQIWLAIPLVLAGCTSRPRSGPEQPALAIKLEQEAAGTKPMVFAVHGLDTDALDALRARTLPASEWLTVFQVFVIEPGKAESTNRPPILGSHRLEGDILYFEPRFPLQPGLTYRAVLKVPGGVREPRSVTANFSLPKPESAVATAVQHVFPSRSRLPENQLKFYLHFSGPMSRGEAYQHVHLLNAAGKETERPFLELDEELWDPEGKRFTLFFDPGRIKRGLKPREDLGPSLEEGKTYTLVIDRQWHDAKGNPLKESYRKTFQVGPPDDQPPDPRNWKLEAPVAGKAQALLVRFPKPLDHAMLQHRLWVVDTQGAMVAGSVAVADEETCWQFRPTQAWKSGTYRLVADTTLEDLAGNRIGRPFEVDVFHPISREIKTETVTVPFEVAPFRIGR
jgi:hypothetical protein